MVYHMMCSEHRCVACLQNAQCRSSSRKENTQIQHVVCCSPSRSVLAKTNLAPSKNRQRQSSHEVKLSFHRAGHNSLGIQTFTASVYLFESTTHTVAVADACGASASCLRDRFPRRHFRDEISDSENGFSRHRRRFLCPVDCRYACLRCVSVPKTDSDFQKLAKRGACGSQRVRWPLEGIENSEMTKRGGLQQKNVKAGQL